MKEKAKKNSKELIKNKQYKNKAYQRITLVEYAELLNYKEKYLSLTQQNQFIKLYSFIEKPYNTINQYLITLFFLFFFGTII